MALTKFTEKLISDSFKTTISGSDTAESSSFASRVTLVEAGSTSKTLVSSSAQIADDISGSLSNTAIGNLEAGIVSGSSQLSTDISGSFGNQRVGTTDSPTFAGGTITGDLAVGGTLTAQEVHTEFESASILFTSGSTQFGNSSDDVHEFKGNTISGSITSTGSFGSAHFMGVGGVGIGTNNPDSQLHVVSAGSPSIRVTDTTNTVTGKFQADNSVAKIGTHTNHSLELFTNNNTALTINNSQNAELAGDLLITDNSDTPLTFKKTSNGEMFIRFLNQDSTLKGALIYRTDSNQFSLRTDGTTALTIDSSQEATFTGAVSASGNISIIKGNARLNVEEVGGSQAYLFSGGSFTALRTTSNTPLQFGANYSSTDTMYIVGDKVGIGESSPSQMLDLTFSGENGMAINSTDSNATLYLQSNGTSKWIIANAPSQHELFISSAAVAPIVTIEQAGNVGIGTNNPGYTLDVKKAVNSDWLVQFTNTSTTNPQGLFVRVDDADSNGSLFGLNNNGTYHMLVSATGNVGIGTTTQRGKLHVQDNTQRAIYYFSEQFSYGAAGGGAKTMFSVNVPYSQTGVGFGGTIDMSVILTTEQGVGHCSVRASKYVICIARAGANGDTAVSATTDVVTDVVEVSDSAFSEDGSAATISNLTVTTGNPPASRADQTLDIEVEIAGDGGTAVTVHAVGWYAGSEQITFN